MNKPYVKDNLTSFLQWNFILKELSRASDRNITLVDYGCNNGELLETLYRNRRKVKRYVGIDKDTTDASKAFSSCKYAEWVSESPELELAQFKADKVCSLGNLSKVKDINTYLQNFKNCGSVSALYYLSSGEEYEFEELKEILSNYFEIIDVFGTEVNLERCQFNTWQQNMYNTLSEYYPDEVISVYMAPFFPEISKNKLWILKRK